jgi:hypothetical protein
MGQIRPEPSCELELLYRWRSPIDPVQRLSLGAGRRDTEGLAHELLTKRHRYINQPRPVYRFRSDTSLDSMAIVVRAAATLFHSDAPLR